MRLLNNAHVFPDLQNIGLAQNQQKIHFLHIIKYILSFNIILKWMFNSIHEKKSANEKKKHYHNVRLLLDT